MPEFLQSVLPQLLHTSGTSMTVSASGVLCLFDLLDMTIAAIFVALSGALTSVPLPLNWFRSHSKSPLPARL
jgi:hypothetical protein